MRISRRDALTGATAAVAVAAVPTIVVATTKPEDPVLVLKREWDARWDEYVSETDDSDEVLDPLHDRLGEITYQILQTPATTIEGVAVKLVLWARYPFGSFTTTVCD